MLAEYLKPRIELSESLLLSWCFQVENVGVVTNLHSLLLLEVTTSQSCIIVRFDFCHNEFAGNLSRVIRVCPSLVSFVWTAISFELITAIKEFADVSADVVSENKLATWMMFDKVSDIYHKVVKNHKLSEVLIDLFEKLPCPSR